MENPISIWLAANHRSKKWLAKKCGFGGSSTVATWIAGENFPRDSSFDALARVMKRDIRDEYLKWWGRTHTKFGRSPKQGGTS